MSPPGVPSLGPSQPGGLYLPGARRARTARPSPRQPMTARRGPRGLDLSQRGCRRFSRPRPQRTHPSGWAGGGLSIKEWAGTKATQRTALVKGRPGRLPTASSRSAPPCLAPARRSAAGSVERNRTGSAVGPWAARAIATVREAQEAAGEGQPEVSPGRCRTRKCLGYPATPGSVELPPLREGMRSATGVSGSLVSRGLAEA